MRKNNGRLARLGGQHPVWLGSEIGQLGRHKKYWRGSFGWTQEEDAGEQEEAKVSPAPFEIATSDDVV